MKTIYLTVNIGFPKKIHHYKHFCNKKPLSANPCNYIIACYFELLHNFSLNYAIQAQKLANPAVRQCFQLSKFKIF